MNTNILDDGSGNETTFNQERQNYEPGTDTLSEETKKKINRLIKEDTNQLQRDDKYYEEMRKNNLPLYRSAKVSEQRFQDYARLGDKYFSETDQ